MKSYISDRVFNGTRPLSADRVDALKRRFGAMRERPNGADWLIAAVSVIVILTVLAAEAKFWRDCRESYSRAVCYVGHH